MCSVLSVQKERASHSGTRVRRDDSFECLVVLLRFSGVIILTVFGGCQSQKLGRFPFNLSFRG